MFWVCGSSASSAYIRECIPFSKQDTGSLSQEPSAIVVPVKPTQPVLLSCTHMGQDVHVEGKFVPDFKSDSESSSGSKESSGQTQHGFPAAMDGIEITSGTTPMAEASSGTPNPLDELKVNRKESRLVTMT